MLQLFSVFADPIGLEITPKQRKHKRELNKCIYYYYYFISST